MPHARAAEAVGLAEMVTHVRVGMSAALGTHGVDLSGLRERDYAENLGRERP